MSAGYDELLVDKFSRGSGSGEPRGILTALNAASPTRNITSTTDGALGVEDVYASWSALGQKYRRKASWLMSVSVANKVREFGSNVGHAYTTTLAQGAIDVLFSRPVYEGAYMPDWSATTGTSTRMIVGDFSHFVIAKRSGMVVETVPMLMDATSNRPTFSRGFAAWARIGANCCNDAAFVQQVNA
jgi:HK97 family phage major capsid protein